jgi:serine/threonine protein kinase/HEAT repeat protein
MSEDTKGRTMIGTVAPRPTRPTASQATANHLPSAGTPTVGMRPHSPSTAPPSIAPLASPPSGDPNDPEALIGQELCGYRIRRKLAEGGMGVVYEGEHVKIGRLGAIKVLKPEFCRADDVVERFYQEARAVNAIHHENIVDIYDFGRDAFGRVFFVMEYLEGEPLSQRIGRGALTWSQAFPILDQTIRALKAAHDKGFVHRDLKPDNIWLRQVGTKVQVKLLDFGIAKLVGSDSPQDRLTRTGSVIGTPHYMSPEQINGAKDIDQRTDIYALGVIMYEMFAGVTPFVGDTLQAIMTGHLFKEPPRLAEIPHDLGVPPPIAEVVDRMLVKDAAARYANVADVLSDLYDINGNRTPTKADTLNRERPTKTPSAILQPAAVPNAPPRKRGALIAIGLIGAAAIAGGAVWATRTPAPTHPVVIDKPTTPGPTPTPPPPPPTPPPVDIVVAREEAQAILHSSLDQTESAVRMQGADTIGEVKEQASLPALIDHTKNDGEDQEVRGHTAEAIGELGGADAPRALLGKLETAAPAPLKVWYASALARLGDPAARKRLATYARSPDIDVAFKAGLSLADVSRPGDAATIKTLQGLANREAELNARGILYGGITILGRTAALHDLDHVARDTLQKHLHNTDQGVQIAAATELAKLGDDAGKQLLHDVVAHGIAANRLLAAVGQIPLGEYGGAEVLLAALDDKDSAPSRLKAAQGLGATGELDKQETLRALRAHATDKDWTVRVAVAGAILQIIGIDPLVLAQASIDWTKAALSSPDLALRKAAAGVLSDIPAKQAMPLLAAAIADKSPDVRLVASKSAGKIKTAEAAEKVADAVKTEKDPKVKEQQVKALGEIGTVGKAAAHDTLAQISEEPGRIGVFAAGSLIAVGDDAGAAKLEKAVAAPQGELRLAAVEAASAAGAAGNKIVVPTLKTGVLDKLFNVRFTAAEGLSAYMDEKVTALPVLQAAAATSTDADVIGRALAAMTRLGQAAPDKRGPADLLDSPDPRRRLAAVAAVRVMPPAEGVPLLRRLIADQDPDVRHASVDAIADVVSKDKEQAIKLYRPLVTDADLLVRNKAAGQLSRLVEPPPPPPVTTAGGTPTPTLPPPPDPKIQTEIDRATNAGSAADTATTDFDAATKDLTATLAGTKHDEATIAKVTGLDVKAREQADAIAAAAKEADAAVKAALDAAGASPAPEVAQKLADAQKLAQRTKAAATAATAKAIELHKQVDIYTKLNISILLTGIKTDISLSNLREAKAKLAIASKQVGKTKPPELDDAYGAYYFKMGQGAATPAEQRKLYQLAKESYQRVVQGGAGELARGAAAAIADIDTEVQALPPP